MRKVLLFLLIIVANATFAQKTVKGLITDKDSKPIEKVKVSIKYTEISTYTDANGKYLIEMPEGKKTLEFSKKDYKVSFVDVTSDVVNLTMTSLADVDIFELSLEELMAIETTVSSAKSQTVFNTPSTVTVIDQAMIMQYGFTDIMDAISVVAGIDAGKTLFFREIPQARGILQGLYGNKVLFLINGVALWNSSTGDFTVSRIDINDVERIEILKGPASVLYGTNAYTGVVNVILKQSNKTSASGNVKFGYPQVFGSGANLNYVKGDFKLLITGNSTNEKRESYQFTGPTSQSSYLFHGDSTYFFSEERRTANFNVIANYKAHRIMVNSFWSTLPVLGIRGTISTGAGFSNDNGIFADYQYNKNINDKLQIIGDVSYSYFLRTYPREPEDRLWTRMNGYRPTASLKSVYNLNKNLAVDLGANYEYRESLKNEPFDIFKDTVAGNWNLNNVHVWEASAYGQINYTFKIFSALIGSRYTKNEFYGDNVSFRGTGVLAINNNNSIKLIYGESFRAPTLTELFYQNPNAIGSANLNPEESKSYELAYLLKAGSFFGQVVGYYTNFLGLVSTTVNDQGQRYYENKINFDSYGCELELKYQAPKVINAFFNMSYVHGLNEDTIVKNTNFYYVPKYKVAFGLNKNIGKFFVSANGIYYSKTNGFFAPVDAQYSFNATIGFSHNVNNKYNITHRIQFININESEMLFPEYNRKLPNFNTVPTTAYGRTILYTMTFNF